jgi:signal transduction histidine kinase
MSFQKFLKEKIGLIALSIFAIISTQILLLTSKMALWIRVYIGVIPIVCVGIALWIEYCHKKHFYCHIQQHLQELNNKYLLSEVMEKPDYIEAELLKEILQETGRSMLENVNTYKHLQEDYKEYIELWIHEIKTPIAASKMIIENNKSEVTRSIEEELGKIENYTEQALFYARSNSVEKDYIITKSNLKEIVNNAVLKNKNSLLANKVSMEIHNIEETVYTDSKWTVFMISQILQNSIQYTKEEKGKIEIYAKQKNEKIVLYIKDNGIGIPKGEITRTFEKGFTGSNGRMIGKKSTGLGLYLCKKLCDKLGLKIELDSEKDVGTEVRIVFPKNSYTNFS